MNFYKRHLGDYAKHAGHLSMLEHGAYTLLLDRYYTVEEPFLSRAAAYRICKARTGAERAAVDVVLDEFFDSNGEQFFNKRAEEEIQRADHQRTVNREIGKLGGRPRKTDSDIDSLTDSVSESKPNRNPSQTPDTRHQTPGIQKPKGSAIALPEWLPLEAWAGFVEMRKRTKAVLTDKAITLAMGELEKLRAQGCDPAEVLNQSTMNAWKGLFPIKQASRVPARTASVLHGPFRGGDYRGNLGEHPDGTVNF